MNAQEWFEKNTYHHSAFSDMEKLIERKKALGLAISVVIPTLNEAETIGNEVRTIRENLMERKALVDEIVVVDSGSTDSTKEEAAKAGAKFHPAADILKSQGNIPGKGENLWKSLMVTEGDIIVWLDADIKNIHPKFVYGLVGPLLMEPSIGYVKGFYDRPMKVGNDLRPSGGGRVSEILIRPLLSLYYPDLAYFMQPLSGEYAGRRELLETLPFSIGYGVEIGLLADIYNTHGLAILAQVDLDMRIHRNRPIHDLGKMSFGILQTFMKHAAKHGKIKMEQEMNLSILQFTAKGEERIPLVHRHQKTERPAINSLAEYTEKKKNYKRGI